MIKNHKEIDRKALVSRHNVNVNRPDPLGVLTVGNGEFAFTADVTGLQTFPDPYLKGIPLCTMSHWGWHSMPNQAGYRLEDSYRYYDTPAGRRVPYPYQPRAEKEISPAVRWLIENPHRLNLGRIGLELKDNSGKKVTDVNKLTGINQCLNLWESILYSSFRLNGAPVCTETCVHPEIDLLAIRVTTPLLAQGRCGLVLAFTYPEPCSLSCENRNKPDRHQTLVNEDARRCFRIIREIDDTRYYLRIKSAEPLRLEKVSAHKGIFRTDAPCLEVTIAFSPSNITRDLPGVTATQAACRRHWRSFWSEGGALDLSDSADPRAPELERRIVLSQYLTAIQCAGSLPPQETGLTHNSWYGKFHLEMHWWHAAHFPLWGRSHLLAQSLGWYRTILKQAQAYAQLQGYRGARWPKQVGPAGRETPSWIGPFLVWQQPHLIYFAELLYRVRRSQHILEEFQDLVFETAEFMASFPVWDKAHSRYVLGPPLCPAQEACILLPGRDVETVLNPAFELAYWRYGLSLAQVWRERLGLQRHAGWDKILGNLSALPEKDGLYIAHEAAPDSYTTPELLVDHPMAVGALGMLPQGFADQATMRRTFQAVLDKWQWRRWTWGWDYPLMAMCAARLGEPECAVDVLLMDTPANRWLVNGHCFQAQKLPVYLPANGGLLTAAALMAAGWDNGPSTPAPGFPKNGQWQVRSEGLLPLP